MASAEHNKAALHVSKTTLNENPTSPNFMKPIFVTLIIFLASYVLLRQIDPGGFVLYQGIALGILASAGLAVWQRKRSDTGILTSVKDGLLTFFVIYAFVFTIPTTVDRSYSVHMINRLAESETGFNQEEINTVYVQYFVDGGGVQKRLDEQQATGTLEKTGGRFVLTPVGRFFHNAFKLTGILFACGTQD